MSFKEITISHADVSATIAPDRGALVSGLVVRNKNVLFLDRATFEDPTKNVRGGIPVLFPFAGKLVDETLAVSKTKMKQHGFGRNKAWTVSERTKHMLRVKLGPDTDTRTQFPYEFVAELTFLILPNGLQIELLISNDSAKPLPVSPGWHPYFCCPGPLKGSVKGFLPNFTPDKIGNDREFDFGLPAPKIGRARFVIPELGDLQLSFSPEMRHMQFWSQPGKDFICLEPFFGPNNTINTDIRAEIQPGACGLFWMRMEIE